MSSPYNDFSHINRPLEEVQYWQQKQQKEQQDLSNDNINHRQQRYTNEAISKICEEFQIIILPLELIDPGREGEKDEQSSITLRQSPTFQHQHISKVKNGLNNHDFTLLEESFGDGSCIETSLYNNFQIMDDSDGSFVYSMAVSPLLFILSVVHSLPCIKKLQLCEDTLLYYPLVCTIVFIRR